MSNVIDLATFKRAGNDAPSRDDCVRLLQAFNAIPGARRRQLLLDFAEVMADLSKRPGQD